MGSLYLLAAEGGSHNPLIPAAADLFWGTVCFVIILGVFWKYVLPRAQQALGERTAGIEGKLEQAEHDRAEAERLLAEYREHLAQARTEAAEIRAQAQADRTAMIDEARREAAAAAEQVTERAQRQIEADRTQVRAELSRDIGRLAVDLASRVVGESLDDSARARNTVDRFLADLESMADEGQQR